MLRKSTSTPTATSTSTIEYNYNIYKQAYPNDHWPLIEARRKYLIALLNDVSMSMSPRINNNVQCILCAHTGVGHRYELSWGKEIRRAIAVCTCCHELKKFTDTSASHWWKSSTYLDYDIYSLAILHARVRIARSMSNCPRTMFDGMGNTSACYICARSDYNSIRRFVTVPLVLGGGAGSLTPPWRMGIVVELKRTQRGINNINRAFVCASCQQLFVQESANADYRPMIMYQGMNDHALSNYMPREILGIICVMFHHSLYRETPGVQISNDIVKK